MYLALPYPPSINHYWRHVGAKVLISREGRDYRARVGQMLHGIQPIAGPLELRVVANPPDARRRDLDNVLKALLDGLQHGGLFEDDSQIKRLSIEWGLRQDGGGVVVEVLRYA